MYIYIYIYYIYIYIHTHTHTYARACTHTHILGFQNNSSGQLRKENTQVRFIYIKQLKKKRRDMSKCIALKLNRTFLKNKTKKQHFRYPKINVVVF